MKNYILKLGLCFFVMVSVSSFAYTLQKCFNLSESVSYSYVSCINNNFDQINRDFFDYALLINYCDNMDNNVESGFIFCINRNFDTISRTSTENLFLSYCSNQGWGLSAWFKNCVNRNFDQITHYLSF